MTDREKPNLLILTSSFPRGADDETCGYIRDFARSVAAEFDVTVLTFQGSHAQIWPQDTFRLIRALSVLPRRLNPLQADSDLTRFSEKSLLVKLLALISLVGFAFDALRLYRHADVICSHWLLPSGLIGAIFSRLTGKPHFAIEHSGALHLLTQMRVGKWLARFILNGCHRLVTVSRDLKDKLLELCPDTNTPIDVLPMGIDVKSITDGQSQNTDMNRDAVEPTILFVGRLTKIKGVDVLLRAAKEAGDLRLIIAGGGEEREPLQALAASLGVNASFTGQVSAEMRNQLLNSCTAVVIPSLVMTSGRTEGMPLVCLEAMAAGRAVIASRSGGLSELIADEHNGLLFDPGNHLMLAEKLKLILSDPVLCNRLAANARAAAHYYDWSNIGQRYCEILKSSLQPLKANEALCR